MGSVASIRDGLKTRVATISGLNVFDVLPQTFVTPAAVVRPGDPLIIFDQTMGRGSDDFVFTVTIYVSLVDETSAQDALDAYLAGSGSSSVKAAIEGDGTLGGAAHFSRVLMAGDYGQAVVNNVPYLSVSFSVGVTASGT
jgi:hypothetical protein